MGGWVHSFFVLVIPPSLEIRGLVSGSFRGNKCFIEIVCSCCLDDWDMNHERGDWQVHLRWHLLDYPFVRESGLTVAQAATGGEGAPHLVGCDRA